MASKMPGQSESAASLVVSTADARRAGRMLRQCQECSPEVMDAVISDLRVLGSAAAPHLLAAKMLRDRAEPCAARSGGGRCGEAHDASDSFGVFSLTHILKICSTEDSASVFVVRGLGALGGRAVGVLRAHFCMFGPVLRVLQCDSSMKHGLPGRRPGSIAFVQMQSAETVRRILAVGPTQQVAGYPLQCQKFFHLPQQAPNGQNEKLQGAEDEEEACSSLDKTMNNYLAFSHPDINMNNRLALSDVLQPTMPFPHSGQFDQRTLQSYDPVWLMMDSLRDLPTVFSL